MRDELVKYFKDKLNVPLFQGMTPEKAIYPCGAYAVADDIFERELDGGDFTSREVIFDVDIVCNNLNEVDLFKRLLIESSGKRRNKAIDGFQLLMLRSAEDVGPLEGVQTTAGLPPQILALRISLFE